MSLSTIFEGVTAAAAVAVAMIANRYAKRHTTLQAVHTLESRLAELDDRYIALGDLPTVFDAEGIEIVGTNLPAQSIIQQRLNVLETFSVSVIEQIIDPSISKRLVRYFLLEEFGNLKGYIEHIRSSENSPDAWIDFEHLAKSWSSA